MLFSRAGQLEPHETALLEQAAAIEERRRQEAIARKPAPGMACAVQSIPPHPVGRHNPTPLILAEAEVLTSKKRRHIALLKGNATNSEYFGPSSHATRLQHKISKSLPCTLRSPTGGCDTHHTVRERARGRRGVTL